MIAITAVADGVTAIGTATGTGRQSYSRAARTTEIVPGTEATTVQCYARSIRSAGLALPTTLPRGLMREVQRSRTATVLEVPLKPTTRQQALTRVARQRQVPTEARQLPKRTTQTPGPIRHTSRLQRQWELWKLDGFKKRQHCLQPASNDVARDEGQYKLRRVARRMARRARTTALPWARQQVATSMRPQTAMSTEHRERLAAKRREPRNHLKLLRKLFHCKGMGQQEKSSGSSAFSGGGGGGGNPGRRVLAVRQAAAAVAVGVAIKPQCSCKRGQASEVLVKILHVEYLEDSMSFKSAELHLGQVTAPGANHSPCRLQQIREAFGQSVCFAR